MKKITVLSALIATALFAGCAATGVQISPIGFDAAKAAALEAAGVAQADAVFDVSELKEYNGQQYYDVEFKANGNEYEYDIDALTGVVLASETDIKASQPAEKPQDNQPQVQQTEAKTESKPAAEPKQESKQPSENVAQKAELIGEEKAKAAALAHAGVKASDAKFVRAELERDDGRTVYEVEFYSGNTEYDYDVDAYSGEILSFDHDAEYYSPQPEAEQKTENKPKSEEKTKQSESQPAITEADAKKIALAQVPGAAENDIRKFEIDRDDGKIEYEGEIHYDGIEYEFEIDGHSGAIRSWEAEPIDRD